MKKAFIRTDLLYILKISKTYNLSILVVNHLIIFPWIEEFR